MRVGKHTEKNRQRARKKVITNPTLLALFPPYSFIWHLRVVPVFFERGTLEGRGFGLPYLKDST